MWFLATVYCTLCRSTTDCQQKVEYPSTIAANIEQAPKSVAWSNHEAHTNCTFAIYHVLLACWSDAGALLPFPLSTKLLRCWCADSGYSCMSGYHLQLDFCC